MNLCYNQVSTFINAMVNIFFLYLGNDFVTFPKQGKCLLNVRPLFRYRKENFCSFDLLFFETYFWFLSPTHCYSSLYGKRTHEVSTLRWPTI